MCAAVGLSAACHLDVSPGKSELAASGGDGGVMEESVRGRVILRDSGLPSDAGAAGAKAPDLDSGSAAYVDAADGATTDAGDAQPGADGDADAGETPPCTDDDSRVVACGRNERGEQAHVCVDGEFRAEDDCDDPDVCVDGDTRDAACGLNHQGTQAQCCAAGQWQDDGACSDPDDCATGATRNVTCGLNDNGTRAQRCAAGQWQDDGACADPDVCVDAATRTQPCGLLDRGTQLQRCAAGQWQNDGTCSGPLWTCDPDYYGTRDGCDCDCGSRDPDCDVEEQELYNCAARQTCNLQGACEDIPSAWACPPEYYATRDGCDCDCGAYDPDCALPGQTLYNCSAGQTCSAAGMCQGG